MSACENSTPRAGISMKITFACDCGKQLQVAGEYAGKRGKCPQCGKVVTIPLALEPSLEVATSDQHHQTKHESTPPPTTPRHNRKHVHPWTRFWARQFDLLIFGFVFGVGVVVIGYLAPSSILRTSSDFGLLWGVPVTFAWVFVEALSLHLLGTTPGKGLLKIRIDKADSSPLTYGDALSRSLKVWFRGMGMGRPIVPLFTM